MHSPSKKIKEDRLFTPNDVPMINFFSNISRGSIYFVVFLFSFVAATLRATNNTSTISRRLEDRAFRDAGMVERSLAGEVTELEESAEPTDLADQQIVPTASTSPVCEVAYSPSAWTSGEVIATMICDRPIYEIPEQGGARIENCT